MFDPSRQYRDRRRRHLVQQARPANNFLRRTASAAVELFVAPQGNIRYTLDGGEPREGTPTQKPIEIGDGDVLLRAFAEAAGIETKAEFRFPAKGKKGVQID